MYYLASDSSIKIDICCSAQISLLNEVEFESVNESGEVRIVRVSVYFMMKFLSCALHPGTSGHIAFYYAKRVQLIINKSINRCRGGHCLQVSGVKNNRRCQNERG